MADWVAADWPVAVSIVAGTTLRSADDGQLPVTGTPVWLNQVHGANVVTANQFDIMPEADGCVSRDPGLACVIRTADCLPVLLCAEDGTVCGAAHAGWRGLAAGVIENTVAAMAVDPATLLAWLGPAISQPAFEVGDEVRAAFLQHDAGAAACFVANARGRWQADLYALARRRLAAAGVTRVSGGGFCTFTDRARFFSYRRNPDCGRMISFVGLSNP